MSDSHDPSAGFGAKATRVILACGIYAGLKYLLGSAAEHLGAAHLDGILAYGAAGGAALLDSAKDIAGDVAAHPVAEAFFGKGEPDKSATGLNHDIERAIARAAAHSIAILITEWQKIPAEQRQIGNEDFHLDDLRTACTAFLQHRGTVVAPEIITQWLEAVATARFLERPELGAAPWNTPPTGPAPQPPCSFHQWFHWRYPAVFQLQFSEQLVVDAAARLKFQLVFSGRLLDYAAHHTAELGAIRVQLDQLAEQLRRDDLKWLGALAQTVLTELQRSLPDLAAAISRDLSPAFLAMLEAQTAELKSAFAASTNDIKQHIDEAIERLRLETQGPRTPALPWRLQLDRYALFAIRNFGKVELLQALARSDDDSQVSLREIFVEPETATLREPRTKDFESPVDDRHLHEKKPVPTRAEDEAARKEMLGKEAASDLGSIVSRRPAFEVLCSHDASLHIILGDPGAGKSTLLRLIVLRWAEDHLRRGCGREDGPAPEPVPLLTEVRGFLAAQDFQPGLPLTAYHCRTAQKEYHFNQPDLDLAIAEGRASLLVDGLDEAFVRQTRDALRSHIRTLAGQHPALRMVVTSRGFNFEAQPWRDAILPPHPREWTFHTVEPFDAPRIERFLQQWHAVGDHEPALRQKRQASLLAAIRTFPHVRRLAVNPMLLTLVCIVVRGGPGEGGSSVADISRRDLYEEAERLLLHRWDNDRGLPLAEGGATIRLPRLNFADKRSFFLRVASTMMDNAESHAHAARTSAASGGPRFDPASLPESNQISEAALADILAEVAPDADALDTLAILRERNYLLCYRGDGTYSFIHRSFLEYFTALNWSEGYSNGEYADLADFYTAVIHPRWPDETWHESLRFLIALLKNPVAVQCLDRLAAEPPIARDSLVDEPEPEALVLAAEFVQELSPHVHTGGSRPQRPPAAGQLVPERRTKKAVVEQWKERLLDYARSNFGGKVIDNVQAENCMVLRQRALTALVTVNRDDLSLLTIILRIQPKGAGLAIPPRDVGIAIADGWAGNTEARTVLLRAAVGRGDIATGPYEFDGVRAHAVRALARGWPGDAEVQEALLGLVIGSGEAAIGRDESSYVRVNGVQALMGGWLGDAKVRVALLRLAVGDGKEGTGKDESGDVRVSALRVLASGWAGDAKVRAACLRAAIGSGEAATGKDNSDFVRAGAVEALASGWSGDAEALAALVRAASGSGEAATGKDESVYVRQRAVEALANGWPGDAEALAAVKRVAADPSESDHVRNFAKSVLPLFHAARSRAKKGG